MEETSLHTASNKVPTLLKVISYYLIIKAGIKALTAVIILVGGESLHFLTDIKGFDTVKNGGTGLQLLLIALAATTIWGGFQLLNLKRIGMYVCIVAQVVSFFMPVYFSSTYQPSMTLFTLSALPIVLLFRYWGRMR